MTAGVEPEKPTHMLTIEVSLRLDGPFPSIVVRDAITAVLSIARVSGRVTDLPQVTLREVGEWADAHGPEAGS